MSRRKPAKCVLLDVDGTLVDTNYIHVDSWQRAFGEAGFVVPAWRIHQSIGMDGGQLVETLIGPESAARLGEQASKRHDEIFTERMDDVRPLPGAHTLLAELRSHGYEPVLASSGKPRDIQHYLGLLDAEQLVHAWTTGDDVDQSKPQPDLLAVAVQRAGVPAQGMIGDSVWDCRAAKRLGIPAIGLLCGGISAGELEQAGATAIRRHPEDLAASIADLLG